MFKQKIGFKGRGGLDEMSENIERGFAIEIANKGIEEGSSVKITKGFYTGLAGVVHEIDLKKLKVTVRIDVTDHNGFEDDFSVGGRRYVHKVIKIDDMKLLSKKDVA